MRRAFTNAGAMVAMALGIGAATAIFSLVRPLLFHPFTFANADQLVTLEERDPQGRATPVSFPQFRDWSAQKAVFRDAAAFDIGFFELTGVDNPEEIPGALVTANLFPMLGVAPALGRTFRDGEEGVVILSDAAWRKHFGADPNILGRSIPLDFARTKDVERYTVIGVMPPNFWLYYGNFEVFVPLERRFIVEDPKARGLIAIGRLAGGINAAQAQAAIGGIVKAWEKSSVDPVRSELLLLAATAGLLLLIASANVAGLLLVRAQARRREIAIRSALGATPARLMRLFIGESARIAIAAALLGGAVAWWGVKTMMAVLPADIETTRLLPALDRVAVDPAAWIFAAIAALVACCAAGLAPAWQARSIELNSSMKSSGTGGRRVLVAIEVALSVVLLAGAGLLLKTLDQIGAIDLGFRAENLLILRVPAPRGDIAPSYYSEVVSRVAGLPGVRSSALYSSLTGRSRDGFEIPGRGEKFTANSISVQSTYFATFAIAMRRGTAFADQDQRHVVINDAFARRYWPGHIDNDDAIGRTLLLDGAAFEISGIAADTRPEVFRDPEPTVYLPLNNGRAGQLAVRTSGDPLVLATAVRGVVRDLGGVVAEVGSMEHFVRNNTWQQEQAATLLSMFAGLALILSALGLYGVISFAIARRTREIGIRVAVGATRANVARIVLLESAQPVIAGWVIGIVLAIGLSRLVGSLLYHVAPADPVVLIAVTGVCAITTLIACAIPTLRALRIDPVTALRQDV